MADAAFLDNIARIDAAIPNLNKKLAADAKAFPDTKEICKIIGSIKGPLEKVLPFIELIPIYGKAIAKALQLLLQLSDTVCQTE